MERNGPPQNWQIESTVVVVNDAVMRMRVYKNMYSYSFGTAALGARYKVQQGQHGKKRNERERYSYRIGLFKPDVDE
jgi:hypothetical protein